jgi:hypothetical protein
VKLVNLKGAVYRVDETVLKEVSPIGEIGLRGLALTVLLKVKKTEKAGLSGP